MSAKTCPKAQVCLRALINNQAVPSSHPNGPHLCCHHQANGLSTPARLCFGVSERCNPKRLVCLHQHQHHVIISKEMKKTKRGKCSLTPDCEARKHPGNKGLFFGVRYMKSAGGGSLADRGLNRQKRICKLSEHFVLPSNHRLVKKLIIQETSTCHLSVTNLRACNKDRTKTNYIRQHKHTVLSFNIY